MKGFKTIKKGIKEIGKEAKDFIVENKEDIIAMSLGLAGCYTGGRLIRKGVENQNMKAGLVGTTLISGGATLYGMALRDIGD